MFLLIILFLNCFLSNQHLKKDTHAYTRTHTHTPWPQGSIVAIAWLIWPFLLTPGANCRSTLVYIGLFSSKLLKKKNFMVNRNPFLSVKANHRRNFPLNEEGFMQITISFVVYFPVSVPPLHLKFFTQHATTSCWTCFILPALEIA